MSSTEAPARPAWAVAGGPVVITRGSGRSGMVRVTIDKVNARSIVAGGSRFTWNPHYSRWEDRSSGGRGWGYDRLLAPDDPTALAYFAEDERRTAAYHAGVALDAWRRAATPEAASALRTALDALAPYLAPPAP